MIDARRSVTPAAVFGATPCPASGEWQQFLDDDAAADDLAWHEHLEACAGCQALLDRLTGLPSGADASDDAAPASAAPRSREGTLPDAQLRRLRGLIVAGDVAAFAGPTSDELLPTIPGYDVRRELGRGGLGIVYEAHHLRLNRVVAIKRMKDRANATQVQLVRFNSDAKFLARLRHPGVVEVYEAGLHGEQPYTVLECVAGGSLVDAMIGGPIATIDAARLIERLARIVDYVHSHGVLHGDLKPGNVLLDVPPSPTGERRLAHCHPKLIDFGLAIYRDQDVRLTRVGDVIGTPQYMAPELIGGADSVPSVASEIYSLGAILYELIAGPPPAAGETRAEVMAAAARGACPPPPSGLRGDGADAALDAICLRAISPDARQRYERAAELADAAAGYLSDRGQDRPVRPPGAGAPETITALAIFDAARLAIDALREQEIPAPIAAAAVHRFYETVRGLASASGDLRKRCDDALNESG